MVTKQASNSHDVIAKYQLYIRERFAHTIRLGNRENGIACVINRDATIIQFAKGDLPPIELGKPYRLSKANANEFLIIGTGHRILKTNHQIFLIK